MRKEIDWSLKFTNAFRSPNVKNLMDKMFKGEKRMKISQEELEEIVVKCSTLILEQIYPKER